MMYLLPKPTKKTQLRSFLTKFWSDYRKRYLLASLLDIALIIIILSHGISSAKQVITPLIEPTSALHPLQTQKGTKEIFGFAPYWTFSKLNNIDFSVLTTFAYFGVDVNDDGSLDKDGRGYEVFKSKEATEVFKKAHANGTRVVLTITDMDNASIRALLDDPDAKSKAISQAVAEVKKRGIDGINVDFEYGGNPGDGYRHKFSEFVGQLTDQMHQQIPSSRVTVSVYAASVKEPKIYDIASLAKKSDGIFMMAYDFAVNGADNAIPTAPLYGYKEGKYWYDVSTAVDDFLTVMSPDKLILGVPWYGYNYLVYQPTVKAETRPYWSWRGQPRAQTYAATLDSIKPDMEAADNYMEGWDPLGEVGFKAYHVTETDTWRMIFLEDAHSLGIKYDFAKDKNLAGVGIWALGFDDGRTELWKLLAEKFGNKLADSQIVQKGISQAGE